MSDMNEMLAFITKTTRMAYEQEHRIVAGHFDPNACGFLPGGLRQVMGMARRAAVQQVMDELEHDWRYEDPREAEAVLGYLRERLTRFQGDDERLEDVERRDFGWIPTEADAEQHTS